MHGLDTIRELNELAAQNKPENVEAELAKADAKWKEQSPLNDSLREVREKREQERQELIEKLAAEPVGVLISRVDGLEYPSTLEAALVIKLKQLDELLKNYDEGYDQLQGIVDGLTKG